jgi:hypothetical protein
MHFVHRRQVPSGMETTNMMKMTASSLGLKMEMETAFLSNTFVSTYDSVWRHNAEVQHRN